MPEPKSYSDFCTEFYFVEKSIEVAVKIGGEERRVRIDVLKRPDETTDPYTTSVYIEETVYPTGPDVPEADPQPFTVWVRYIDFPSTLVRCGDVDAALADALGHLRDKGSK